MSLSPLDFLSCNDNGVRPHRSGCREGKEGGGGGGGPRLQQCHPDLRQEGIGIEDILEAVVQRIPAAARQHAEATASAHLRLLL